MSGAEANRVAERFYAARDVRTVQYGGDTKALSSPIALVIAPGVAQTRAGQVAAFAMVDMLLRVHRNVRIDAPDTPVVCPGRTGSLRAVLIETAGRIDPFQNTTRAARDGELIVLVGDKSADASPDVQACWHGGRGEVRLNGRAAAAPTDMPAVTDSRLDLLGAATASVLAAAAVFRLVHGQSPRSAAVNVLERSMDDQAGVMSFPGPVDVGDVLIVGAGAVTHGLVYWLREIGVIGKWEIVDGDIAQLHNTSRCLAMTVADAGWPNGIETGQPRDKAKCAAALVAARSTGSWWHDYPYAPASRPDVLLLLANEYGVRTDVATLGLPLILQATTSPNWTAELHRHVAGRDDCPGCRLPQLPAQLLCATGPSSPGDNESSDAALPFLSAGAGLLLTAGLLDLPDAGPLLDDRVNHWRLHLELGANLWQRLPHAGGACPHELPTVLRQQVRGRAARRWDHLDAA